jgi:hypothetical protein
LIIIIVPIKEIMKTAVVVLGLLIGYLTNTYGQWYTNKYQVSDIDYLTQQQLEESVRDTKTGIYGSLAVLGTGGLVILAERFIPYKEEDDDNVTIIESLLGEKGVHTLTIAGGIVIAAGGAIASIVYLSRIGTIKSALNRNFPVPGSLSLSPALLMERYSHSVCPGITVTFNF